MRQHVLIAYDIADPRRLDRVRRLVADASERIQYSVYCGQFSRRDLVVLRERLRDVIHATQDQVLFLPLGPVRDDAEDDLASLEFLGRRWAPRDLRVMVF